MFFNIQINKREYEYFWYINVFLQLLYFALILGTAFINITYVHYIIASVHIFICIFLMLKFNRFLSGGITVNEYEKKFIFTASFILLINIFIYELGISLDVNKLRMYIDKFKQKLRD